MRHGTGRCGLSCGRRGRGRASACLGVTCHNARLRPAGVVVQNVPDGEYALDFGKTEV